VRTDRARTRAVLASALVGLAVSFAAPASAQSGAPGGDTWVSDGNTAAPRREAQAFTLPDGRVILLGGGMSPGASLTQQTAAASIEQFDPATSTWTTVDSPSSKSLIAAWSGSGHAVQLPDGRLLVASASFETFLFDGTEWAAVHVPTSEPRWTVPDIAATDTLVLAIEGTRTRVLDISTGTVSEVAGPATRRADDSGSLTRLADGRVLLAGGYATGHALTTVELYDPVTSTWSETGPMNEGRAHHSATLLADGRVLVTGGFGVAGHLASAEVYDPDGGTWSAVAPMGPARDGHRAALLADGRVLVTGGLGVTAERRHGPLDDVAVYDPWADAWSDGPSLPEPRWEHAIARSGQRVLVIGGRAETSDVYAPGAVATSTFEIDAAALPAASTSAPASGAGTPAAASPSRAAPRSSGVGTTLAVMLTGAAFLVGVAGGFAVVRRRMVPAGPELTG
jgi:hypothetical protein